MLGRWSRVFAGAAIFGSMVCLFAQQASVSPAGTSSGSAPATVPLLDVITVRPNRAGANGGMSWGPTPDGVMGKNLTVHQMLVEAYHANDNQLIDEPDWAKSEHFDFTGKVTGPDAALVGKLTPDQKRVYFEQVLKERFGLAAHHETRELPEYALTPAKGGVKLEDGKADLRASRDMKPNLGWYRWGEHDGVKKAEFSGTPIIRLLPILSNETARTVVDKSGLTGKYNFTLSWRAAMAQAEADDGAVSTPDLFTALQEQLGLKLEPIKGPVDVVVIDHLERPGEN
ncbi:MAG TPA: TIGR03435 family protein [Acidobacteriaceae bacterium]|nr:TIGR03435 family protein [Acidobacteriaceae bacterium]